MLPKGGESLWDVGADIADTTEQRDSAVAHTTPMIRMTSRKEEEEAEEKQNQAVQQETLINDESIFDEQELVVDPIDESHITTALKDFSSRQNHTTSELVDFLLKWGSGYGNSLKNVQLHSYDDENDSDDKEEPSLSSMKNTWHDVTTTPLPYAPDMKIYCLYGVGLDTERSYYYKRNDAGNNNNQPTTSPDDDSTDDAVGKTTLTVDPPFVFDTTIEDPTNKVYNGVKYVNGDGSVPLLSQGYMCVDGWKYNRNSLNPSNIKVITREYQHRNEFTVDDPFRSPYSAEHVDILGNVEMLHDYLKIVSDFYKNDDASDDNGNGVPSSSSSSSSSSLSSNKIVSDIENIAKRINDKRNIHSYNGYDHNGDSRSQHIHNDKTKRNSNMTTRKEQRRKWKRVCFNRFLKKRKWFSFLKL